MAREVFDALRRNRKVALGVALIAVLALVAGGAALADSPGADSHRHARGVTAVLTADESDAPDDAQAGPDGPGPLPGGRLGCRGRGILALIEYLDMKPSEFIEAVRGSGCQPGDVLMAAPVAKLGDKPLADVLALREGGASWTEICDRCGVDVDDYLDELQRVLVPAGRMIWRQRQPGAEKPGAGQGQPGDEEAPSQSESGQSTIYFSQ